MERPPRIARYATLVSATMTAVKVMGRTTWSARYETVKLFSSTVLGNKKKQTVTNVTATRASPTRLNGTSA